MDGVATDSQCTEIPYSEMRQANDRFLSTLPLTHWMHDDLFIGIQFDEENRKQLLHVIKRPNYSGGQWRNNLISVEAFRHKTSPSGWKHHTSWWMIRTSANFLDHERHFVNVVNKTNTDYDFRYGEDSWKKLVQDHEELRDLPILYHDSLWEFYKFVGWDYKKGKLSYEGSDCQKKLLEIVGQVVEH